MWPGIAGAVVTDGVGEAVRAVVVGVRRIAHAAAREADRAVAARPHRDHRQTGIERGVRLSASVSLASTSMALLLESSATVAVSSIAPPAHR